MANRLLVSFATRPGHGGEAGVGWQFVRQAAQWCRERDDTLYVVIDGRDALSVEQGLERSQLSDAAHVLVASIPAPLRVAFAGRRSRLAYLWWLPRARTVCRRLARQVHIASAHQVTFASATMPSVVRGIRSGRTLWGPLAVPNAVTKRKLPYRTAEYAAVRALQFVARRHTRSIDRVISTNASTASVLRLLHSPLEPNIFLETPELSRPGSDDKLLSMCGLLIERKRPWIAVRALADPRLCAYRLLVIGDGPLRGELSELADVLGVSERITYVGRVDHQTAQSLVASTRALLHPAAREGAAWVVGEAAAMGVPAVVIEGGGAESTVRECANGGGIAKRDRRLSRQVALYVDAVADTLRRPRPEASHRWEADRIPRLLDEWWL